MRAHRPLLAFVLVCAVLWTGWSASGAHGAAAGLPAVPLLTQDGEPVRFDALVEGKVAVINFVFAGCSSASDRATARLREVQEVLGERMGREVFFYSITVAPESDTPAALKRYAEKFRAGPGWLFLTGNSPDIARLRDELAAIPEVGMDGAAALIIAAPGSGRWTTASPAENPAVLAALLARR